MPKCSDCGRITNVRYRAKYTKHLCSACTKSRAEYSKHWMVKSLQFSVHRPTPVRQYRPLPGQTSFIDTQPIQEDAEQ